jgi:hypothetical protein
MKNPSPGSCFGGFGRPGDGTVPIGGADHDDAPHVRGLHRGRDGRRAPRGDPGVGLRPCAKAGQDRVGPADRGLQRRRIRGRQVGPDDADRLP